MPALLVERNEFIKKPRVEVYAEVRDFSRWPTWSPWLICEPECQVKFAEDGRSYSWDGKIIGSGGMTIQEEEEGEWICYELQFLKPWKSKSKVRFTFKDEDGGTRVNWSMNGSLPWFIFFLKKMMEGMVGMDYERGLLMLKSRMETGEVASQLEVVGVNKVSGFRYVGLRNECDMDDLGESMKADFEKLEGKVNDVKGPAFAQYVRWDFGKRRVGYIIGIPSEEEVDGDLETGEIPSLNCFQIRHVGNYKYLGNAWSTAICHGRAKTFRQSRKVYPFEIYETSPKETSEDESKTLVCMPVK